MGGLERVSNPIVSRDLIGRQSDEVLIEVERGAIRKFAEAVGDTTELGADVLGQRHACSGRAGLQLPVYVLGQVANL